MSTSQPTPEQVKSWFDYIDSDEDGRVTWDEVAAYSAQHPKGGAVITMVMEGKDVKKDQSVNLEEFKALFGL